MPMMPIEEKIKRCLERHPEWTSKRISNSTGGIVSLVESIRGGGPIEEKPRAETSGAGLVTLADVRQRFDIPAAIKRELGRLGKGQLMPEDELCRLTAGRDRNRFRRAVDNNPALPQTHRVKLRLDDSGDGKFFWGNAADISEARHIYEQ